MIKIENNFDYWHSIYRDPKSKSEDKKLALLQMFKRATDFSTLLKLFNENIPKGIKVMAFEEMLKVGNIYELKSLHDSEKNTAKKAVIKKRIIVLETPN